jgi:tRNA (guanine6-N2)-methyltransferase
VPPTKRRLNPKKPAPNKPAPKRSLAFPVRANVGANVGALDFEAEVLPGLEPFALAELKRLSGVQQVRANEGAVGFRFVGDAAKLAELRTVVAVYRTLHFEVPRPKALLGHEHLSRLGAAVAALPRRQSFGSFRLSAAGSDSAVYTRLAESVAQETGLPHQPNAGELLVRVRRAQGEGWVVLLRLTPRPLSARPWRVCNLPGGLNAGLAAAMLELAAAGAHERVFNPMCGSGTLLLEQGLRLAPRQLLGCDHDPAALACSAENARAAGLEPELFRADATRTRLESGSVDVIVTDPPWGDAVGKHSSNAALYPALLLEFARVAAPGARLVLLTHELKLFERVLAAQRAWGVVQHFRVFHGGHYPHVYLLTPQ